MHNHNDKIKMGWSETQRQSETETKELLGSKM